MFSSIVVYGSVDTAAQCLLTLGPDPEGCPVLCLKHSPQHLFAALQSGTVVVYARSSTGKVLLGFISLEAAVFSLFSICRLKPGLQILRNTSHVMSFHTILVACSHQMHLISVCNLTCGTKAVEVDSLSRQRRLLKFTPGSHKSGWSYSFMRTKNKQIKMLIKCLGAAGSPNFIH